MTFNKWKLWSVFESQWTNISKAMNNSNQAPWVLAIMPKIPKNGKVRFGSVWPEYFDQSDPTDWNLAFHFDKSVDSVRCLLLFSRFSLICTNAGDCIGVSAWHNSKHPVKPKSAWLRAFYKLRERLLARWFGWEVGKPIERCQRSIKNFHRACVNSYLSTLFPRRWYMTPSTVNAYYSPSRNQIGTFSPRVDS